MASLTPAFVMTTSFAAVWSFRFLVAWSIASRIDLVNSSIIPDMSRFIAAATLLASTTKVCALLLLRVAPQ